MSVEHIRLGLQLDNPDGNEDHKTLNISEAHAEITGDTIDMHLLVKNPKTRPFIDFGFVGKLDLANVSNWIKLEPGTRMAGLLNASIHAKGNIFENEKQKKDVFQSRGTLGLLSFSYTSKTYPHPVTMDDLLMTFNSKNISVDDLNGTYLATHVGATGTLNNFFDFAIRNKPLNATIDLKSRRTEFKGVDKN